MPGVCRSGAGFGRRRLVHRKRRRGGAAAGADYQDSVRRSLAQRSGPALRLAPPAESVPGPGATSKICDGAGDDDPIVFAAEVVRARRATAVEAGGLKSVLGLDIAGRSSPSRMGANGEVLRKPESGLPDSNHAAGMAAG